MPHPIISVVVLVGPTTGSHLGACIASILQSDYSRYELILVANTASDRRIRSLRKEYPSAKVIGMGRNTGIEGYNTGIREAKGEFVLILDEDCEIQKDILGLYVDRFRKESGQTAAIAAHVYNVNQKSPFYRKVPWLDGRTLFTFPGGATAFRKKAIDDVGGFDTEFFLWLHEDDLALRLLDRGYRIVFDSHVRIVHHDQESEYREFQANLIFRNKAWLNIKYFSLFLWPILLIRDVVWMISFAFYKRNFSAFTHSVAGYLAGYNGLSGVWKKRSVLSPQLQIAVLYRLLTYRNSVS